MIRWPDLPGLRAAAMFCVGVVCALFAPGVRASAPAVRPSVVVIHAVDACAAGERSFSESLAGHVVRWLRAGDVAVESADDRTLDSTLHGRRLAFLVALTAPTPSQMGAFARFRAHGGRLVVFYSASAPLATLMGVRLTGYKRAAAGGWSRFVFNTVAPDGCPASVLQTSANIYGAAPIAGRSRVIADWFDRSGRAAGEPAWLASDAGYWMTHVLLADGDEAGKAQLVLALVAGADPSVWADAARRALADSATVGGLGGAAGLARLGTHRRPVADEIARVRADDASARADLAAGRGYSAWVRARRVLAGLRRVYGLMQSARPGEIHAVWDHSGAGLYPGDWPRTMRVLRAAHVTDLFVNVAGAGFAHYPSRILPRSALFDEEGDQLAACLVAARGTGIRVHAWVLCFSAARATPDRLAEFSRRGWRLRDAQGRELGFLDPSNPEVRARMLEAVAEIARLYPVAGVHLDFVRWNDFASSQSTPAVTARFNRESAVHSRRAFFDWRAHKIGGFVAEARRRLASARPGLVLSTAVYGKYPSCVEAVGQDWESWIGAGIVDYVVPMDYTESTAKFDEWVRSQGRTPRQARKVIAGIGVTASESRLDAAQVIDQIKAARRAGLAGFALFDLDATLENDILPVLNLGIL